MIPNAIFQEHVNKEVRVTTINGSFSGLLDVRNNGMLVVLRRTDEYNSQRYGSIYIDAPAVIAITEIKPYENEYDGEDDCEKESSKKYAKVKEQQPVEDKQMVWTPPNEKDTL